MDGESKVRTEPRVTLNKLAEYMVCTPARRRAIVRDQKYPREVLTARYNDAYAGITEALLTGSLAPVYEKLDYLYGATPKTNWEAQDKQLSAEALESFLTFVDEIDLQGATISRTKHDHQSLHLSGVEVSVRPDLFLRINNDAVGAVKLSIAKQFPMDATCGAYAAVLLHHYMNDAFPKNSVAPDRCVVIDVFGRSVHVAPRRFKQRRNELAAACDEISQRWPAV